MHSNWIVSRARTPILFLQNALRRPPFILLSSRSRRADIINPDCRRTQSLSGPKKPAVVRSVPPRRPRWPSEKRQINDLNSESRCPESRRRRVRPARSAPSASSVAGEGKAASFAEKSNFVDFFFLFPLLSSLLALPLRSDSDHACGDPPQTFLARYYSTIMVPPITQLCYKKLALSLDRGPNLSL